MKSCRLINLSIFFMFTFCSQLCSAQYEKDHIVMRLSDFRVMNFEKKTSMGKGNYITESLFFIHQPTDNTNRVMSSAALRFGYERHNYWNEKVSYFGGCDLAAGYELLNVKYSPQYSLDFYGAMGYELGLSFDITKSFAIGVQSALWLKWMIPIRQLDDDSEFDIRMVTDVDILSFNLIFKIRGNRD